MTLQEIFALPTEAEKIIELKKRVTPLPNYKSLMADWDPKLHDVMNPEKRKDGKKLKMPEVRNELGVITTKAEFETDPVNRIPMPIEQDETNIHTAFTVGTEPKLLCEPNSDQEKELLSIIKQIEKKNKVKYLNKKAVRSWLSETEVAEYWYTIKDDSFWTKVMSAVLKVFSKSNAVYKLKVAVWSPFRGDSLYPLFDDQGDLVAFSRGYKIKVDETTEKEYFMTMTKDQVYKWDIETGAMSKGHPFKHGFEKMPITYMYRPETLCEKIKPVRERIETLLSNYADCIDYNFFPKLVLEGELNGVPTKGNGDMIKLEANSTGTPKVYYLTWNQTPESVKLELEYLWEKAYSLTNTPRISMENLKGIGQQSGIAFKFTFMGAHMAVENHAEVVGEYLQRRYNFLVSAVGTLNTTYTKAAQTIDIEVEIVPYMIDDLTARISNAVAAVQGGIATTEQGVIMAGLTDAVEDTVKEIEDASAKKAELNNFPNATM